MTPVKGSRQATGEHPSIRLTYRTTRVLAVIAAQSGLSNSEIAERGGIADQGQVSKLLGRLNRLGLIENTGEGQPGGATNAWRLTGVGRRLQRAIERAPAQIAP
jgi:chromosome segregation and condensation protein ScpB